MESFATLLTKWQRVQNLVSRETLNEFWDRHVADSLQVLKLTDASDLLFLDFGSGGGLPALPMAIASKGSPRRFVLIEPNARKVSFLRTVSRELDLQVTVIGKRGEETDSRETGVPDVITSRALTKLDQLFSWIVPYFGPGTAAILHKGGEHVEEMRQAGAHWESDVVVTQSDTDPRGVLLKVNSLRRKPA
ncbi:16S rRNA (guanine(527)-N(7))-methyltransferase RsmG [Devosia sp. PTR5]|uniref:Ribosomal RNA small subunit methyltransferase G n=1 Tax=Devosia oryzisoli TaxID=2774138 RepID=A0A927FXJ6_9HYPH|nr:16S rRNA (guanine(527)-N(7))-methyltransferase RsmG [Devosia oryzisoli]MBD8066489.1 16S rRNA (guanine(527)-N(7))-methyltransferase RsmG [Devosia oryzisoli]